MVRTRVAARALPGPGLTPPGTGPTPARLGFRRAQTGDEASRADAPRTATSALLSTAVRHVPAREGYFTWMLPPRRAVGAAFGRAGCGGVGTKEILIPIVAGVLRLPSVNVIV